MRISAGTASRLRTMKKLANITLNIPQLARLGLFSRSTKRGFGILHSRHSNSPSVRDATTPAMSGSIEKELNWIREPCIGHLWRQLICPQAISHI